MCTFHDRTRWETVNQPVLLLFCITIPDVQMLHNTLRNLIVHVFLQVCKSVSNDLFKAGWWLLRS